MMLPANQPPNPALIIGVIAALSAATITAAVALRRRGSSTPVDHETLLKVQRDWRAPIELTSTSMPRPAKWTAQAFFMMGAAGVSVLTTVIAGWFVWQQITRADQVAQQLARDGVTADAIIGDKSISNGKSPTYRVTYRYDVAGHSYGATVRVTRDFYNSATRGSRTRVTYSQSQPSISRIDGTVTTPWWIVLVIVGAGCAVVPVIAFVILRQRRLLAFGTPACAIVQRVSPTKGGWQVTYRFIAPNGDDMPGACAVTRKSKPALGTTLTIVYDPDRPKSNSRYPLNLVKLDT